MARATLHPYYSNQSRTPHGPRNELEEFIASCEGEGIPLHEIIKEYQEEWCSHRGYGRRVVAVLAQPNIDEYRHIVECMGCGKLMPRQGRAPNAR